MYFENNVFQIVMAICVALFYLISFFILGSCYTRNRIKNMNAVSVSLIMGMFSYFLLFEIIAFPMKMMQWPLHRLAYVWGGTILGADCLIGVSNKKYIQSILDTICEMDRRNRLYWGMFFLFLGIQLVVILGSTPQYMGVRDDYYYIGNVTTSLYKDAIQIFDYTTGEKLKYFDQYFIPMYPIQGAVICKLTGLHPIIENKWSSEIVMLLVSNLIYYELAYRVFKGDRKKILETLIFLWIITYNIQSNGVTTGIFYFYRLSEGKGILSNIILPALVYFFYRIVEESDDKRNWLMIFVVIVSSYTIVMSSMFLVPVSLMGLFGAFLLVEKKWKYCINVGICMMPCVLIIIIHLLRQLGYISLAVK